MTSLLDRAEQTLAAVQQHYYRADENLYIERVDPIPTDREYSTLWPFSALISGLNALAPIDRRHVDALRDVFNVLESYYDADASPTGYDSYIRRFGGGDKFYDDNEWLGLDFADMYTLTGERHWLQKSREMFDFAISGWSDDMDGGIYWKQFDLTTKNTCSNGPAAVLALKLYNATQEAAYLDWAVKILSWARRLKDESTGVYFDLLSSDGHIDEHRYTYNVGTPLHANAMLYTITKEARYLDEANHLARAADAYFCIPRNGSGVRLYPDTPWFNAVLLRGYRALHEAGGDPAIIRTCLDGMTNYALYAWDHARDSRGLFAADASGSTPSAHLHILDNAAMVEIYATLHHLTSIRDTTREGVVATS